MWLDDQYWLPFFLDEKIFRGTFVFQGHDELLEQTVTEVDSAALNAVLPPDWVRPAAE